MTDDPKGTKQRAPRRRGRPSPGAEAPSPRYQDFYTADEVRQLGEAAASARDLTSEVELLRVLVARAVASGADVETVSRAVGRLANVIKTQHVISGDAARGLDDALAKVLAEIGTEIGL